MSPVYGGAQANIIQRNRAALTFEKKFVPDYLPVEAAGLAELVPASGFFSATLPVGCSFGIAAGSSDPLRI